MGEVHQKSRVLKVPTEFLEEFKNLRINRKWELWIGCSWTAVPGRVLWNVTAHTKREYIQAHGYDPQTAMDKFLKKAKLC